MPSRPAPKKQKSPSNSAPVSVGREFFPAILRGPLYPVSVGHGRARFTVSAVALLAGAAFLSTGRSARAQTTYTDSANGTVNFSAAFAPPIPAGGTTTADTLVFSNTATSTQTDDLPTATQPLNANVLTFSNSGTLTLNTGAGTTITLGGTAPTVNLNNSAGVTNNLATVLSANTTFTGNGVGGATFNGVISGAGFGLTKTGSSSLTLTNTNTYTGGTTINGGFLTANGNVEAFGGSQLGGGGTLVTLTSGTLNLVNNGGSNNGIPVNNIYNNNLLVNGTSTLSFSRRDSGYDGKSQSLSSLQIGANTLALNNANGFGLFITGATIANGAASITTGATSFNYSSAVNLNSLTLGNAAPAGNTAITLGGNGTMAVGGVISDNGAKTLSIVKTGTGRLTLGGDNTNSGGTTLSAGTLIVDRNANFGSSSSSILFNGGTLQVNGTSLTSFGSHPVTFTAGTAVGFDIANAGNNFTVSQNVLGTTFTKTDAGSLTLSGANAITGATSLSGGTTTLDYSTNNNRKLGNTSLALTGAAINLSGGSGVTEQFTGTTLNAGASSIARASGSNTVGLAAITRSAGSTLNVSGAGVATTSTTNTNGILGGYATVGGTDWAVNSTNGANGPIVALASGSYTPLATTAGTDTNNSIQTGSATLTGSVTTNSLKIITSGSGQSLDIGAGNVLTLSSGGLLFTGADDYSINNGSLRSATATNSDLIIHQNGAGVLTIGSVLALGANGTSTLTKSGTGTLSLTASNTYAGATFVNGGTLRINSAGNLGTGAATVLLTLNGGTLQEAAGTGALTVARNTALGANGGTFDVGTGDTLTMSGAISSVTTNVTGGLIKTGSGTLILSGGNTYTGGTTINGGTVQVGGGPGNVGSNTALGDRTNNAVTIGASGTLALNGAATNFTTNGAGLFISGLNGVAGAIVQNGSNTNGTTLYIGNDTANTFAGTIQNGGTQALSLVKLGAGSLTLSGANTYTGGTTIQAGTLVLGNAAALSTTAGTIAFTGGTLQYGTGITTNYSPRFSTNGGQAFRIDTNGNNVTYGSQIQSSGGSFTKLGTGSLTLSSATSSYSGTTTVSAGELIAGAAAPSGATGAFGNATSAIVLGDVNTTANNSSASLLTGGAFTIGRAVTIADQATSGTYTIGGNTATTSSFSGLITANQSFNVSQITGGTLNVTGGITSGNAGAKTVTFNNVGAVNVSTIGISDGGGGTLAVTKTGTGTTTFSAVNTYTGATTINAGALLVNGSTAAASAVTVNNTGTLGGNGSIGGATTINGGGTLAPGSAATTIGTLTLAANTFFTGSSGSLSTFLVDLNATTADKMAITGNLDLGTLFDQISFNTLATPAAASYQLATFTGSLNGIFDTVTGLPSGYALQYVPGSGSGGEIDLVAVPEPGTVAAGLLALGTLGVSQRRRLRRFLSARRQMAMAA